MLLQGDPTGYSEKLEEQVELAPVVIDRPEETNQLVCEPLLPRVTVEPLLRHVFSSLGQGVEEVSP